ncbi:hypothetical protein XU18_4830 [Perkinsela sp. CCAP 1560/4]|nr:hypothetical protein XU18_4830 [Perkinsela sp. CCAP 1560/4]|eukprot:KNH03754.1 hypothetical protein XU18_4830 [Perkinsela sp. CCAP 1560/4]
MFPTAFFACADDGIGKVDRSTLSQQALMELFILGLENVEDICGSRDEPSAVCTWEGVRCNSDGEVEAFQWKFKRKAGTGTIGLKFLPSSMKDLNMSANAISGTMELADLPENVKKLSLAGNALSANPTKGHLSVVGWTSTPVLGEAKNLFKPLVVFLSWRRPY